MQEDLITWFTGTLAIAAVVQICVYIAQTRYMGRQARLMHHSLVAQFRPRVHVRSVRLVSPDDSAWNVSFSLVNLGGTRATIKHSDIAVKDIQRTTHSNSFSKGLLPVEPPYGKGNSLGTVTLEAGQHVYKSIDLSDKMTAQCKFLANAVVNDGSKIGPMDRYFVGYIDYTDDTGVVRRTGFCYRYDANTMSFVTEHDPNYNYSD